MKLLRSGMHDGAAVNHIRGWMDASAGPRDERWQTRYDDIPRSVRTAREKIAPTQYRGTTGEMPGQGVLATAKSITAPAGHTWCRTSFPKSVHGLISGQWGTYQDIRRARTRALVHERRCRSSAMRSCASGGVLFIALEGTDEVPIRLQAVIEDRGKIPGRGAVRMDRNVPAANRQKCR